ncbi:hypothetical protein ADK60_01740 [Streptomyces sp. XY431]|uniref:hypothetical protein n=1 Tax=Streptomyces sp. XY431 TaxID=1415562 RepID=UPI0006AE2530|nr:hypothetical protein [Streptomyces sp. XY431]KOV38753.1 hypothetical protein ADK60_01740 [Streptomyces sp. XY431]
MKDYDLEKELAAAMLDRSRQEPPGSYDVDGLIGSVRQRRRRLQAGAAAAVAIVALGAGFLSRADHGRVALPVQGSTAPSAEIPSSPPPSEPPSPTASASASASASKPAAPAAPSRTTNALFLAALRYQNPATRAEVDPAEVAALFANESTYQRIWGTDSRGVTCGAPVDGVLASGEVLLYQGVERLDRTPALSFDGVTGKVTDLTCRTVVGDSKGGDPTVSGFYGGLVAATKSGDSTAVARLGRLFVTAQLRSDQGPTAGTCSSTTPPFWLADNPSSGTLTHGWTVNLGGPQSFPIEIDETAKIAGSCGK